VRDRFRATIAERGRTGEIGCAMASKRESRMEIVSPHTIGLFSVVLDEFEESVVNVGWGCVAHEWFVDDLL
jgi:hypothetical protein